MSSMGSLSRRYARSLFSLAKEENALDKFYQDTQLLSQLLLTSPEVLKTLGDDLLDYNGRLAACAEISDKLGLHSLVKNFLLILIKKDRMKIISQILKEFEVYRDEYLSIVRVNLLQTQVPHQDLIKKVEALLETKLSKKIIAKGSAKPEMIGGSIVQVGNITYDGSIKRELELLKEKMLRSEV
ncbi:MAG: ATP synthase F1 subunit delta [Deltaproteobacteria bacterium]|nr:MAG: ATP synthase F1 subunit delta [Deltaproteobacteria bacterium]